MKRLLMYSLFFFCLIALSGCEKWKDRENKGIPLRESEETKEEEDVLVLIYGNDLVTGIASTVCDRIGAVCYSLAEEKEETIKTAMKNADYILLGTDKDILEWEFSLRNCLDEADLIQKKIALFLLNQTEKAEQYESEFMGWYPSVNLLPTFTLDAKENIAQELGRMNGWLTTIMTYGKLKD